MLKNAKTSHGNNARNMREVKRVLSESKVKLLSKLCWVGQAQLLRNY